MVVSWRKLWKTMSTRRPRTASVGGDILFPYAGEPKSNVSRCRWAAILHDADGGSVTVLLAEGTIGGWSLWAALVILSREILVSGLRESLAEVRVSVPVSRLAKWKTTVQMVAIAFLLLGPAGESFFPYTEEVGLTLLWIAAIVTLYTGYDYFRAGFRHLLGSDS